MKRLLSFASCLFVANALAVRAQAAEAYHFIKEIPVGGEGGWDYLTTDAAAQRLYVSHATKVVVIDTGKDVVAGEIMDTPGIHGIALAQELSRGFCSNGKESMASIVDLKTLKTVSKVATGENPDAILYEPDHKEVYAFNGRGHSATVFDAQSGKVTATIPLSGKPEFAVADPKAGWIYDAIEDKNEIVAIDASTHQVVASWPVGPGEEPSGLAIDTEHHRLFVGCGNKLMVMMDSVTGKILATVPIGDHVDATAYDPGTGLVFASCGEGTTTIAMEESPGKLVVVQVLKTEPGARTMALDPSTHKIYLATAQFEAQAASGGPVKHPKALPNTMKILVYGIGG